MDSKVVMSEDEVRILCEIYIDEEHIKEGLLDGYQKECLEQIRYAKEYLSEKYPGKVFTILHCMPADIMHSYTDIQFYEEENASVEFDMRIRKEQETYVGEDNYYGVLIRDDYDTMLQGLLQSVGIKNCMVYSQFSGMEGKEINGSLTGSDILKLGDVLSRDTDIFIDSRNMSMSDTELVDCVKSVIMEKDIYGSYTIYIENGLLEHGTTGEECEAYIRGTTGTTLYKEWFNNF